ncbi:MAG: MBL fold metallo-hydrolase [Patescibacteria group bacterium]|jgi:phosphoribosyl 1,2-cyclic phosphate phosphodiesterase|nr:MBL fold metallo-hydrolase [Lutibacter sp.]MDX9778741.1 MBL fold metallo-hydrolase [Patescibacteria group bacterium]
MDLQILGSGGTMTVPRPLCSCAVCSKARRKGGKYKRNNASFFIKDKNILIDCGEDIADSLNRHNISKVDNLFITHWHPDHTFGLRVLLESGYNFRTPGADKIIEVYIPKKVFEDLKAKFPVIDYLLNFQKTGNLHLIEDGDEIEFGNLVIEAVGYNGVGSDHYAYLIKENNKRVLYAPCDTIDFNTYEKVLNLDLLIHECGMFFDHKTEIKFPNLINRLRTNKPAKTIFTHIEEVELRLYGESFKKAKKDYSDVKFDFAFDGMKIKI